MQHTDSQVDIYECSTCGALRSSDRDASYCGRATTDVEPTEGGLADTIERDRSVIRRHLNNLVTLGVVEKRLRVLAEGESTAGRSMVDRLFARSDSP